MAEMARFTLTQLPVKDNRMGHPRVLRRTGGSGSSQVGIPDCSIASFVGGTVSTLCVRGGSATGQRPLAEEHLEVDKVPLLPRSLRI